MVYAISFENYNKFLDSLIQKTDVFAPVKGKVSSFEKLKSAEEFNADVLTEYTAKNNFLKQGELILTHKEGEVVEPDLSKIKEKILLGLRMCDLASIKKHDIAMNNKYADPYYNERRKKVTLFGYHQKQCGDEYCFCQSVDLEVEYDLFFYKRADHYLVEVGSDKGKTIIKDNQDLFEESDYKMTKEDKEIDNQLKLDSHDIDDIYTNNRGWSALVKDCLACGQCNALCPTCFCFEFRDVPKQDGSVEKKRFLSECQLECFSRVAGDHIFRKAQIDRFKHRIYHQLQYFKDKFGKTLCTGCGRCIRHCPTKIDFVTKINEMKKEAKK